MLLAKSKFKNTITPPISHRRLELLSFVITIVLLISSAACGMYMHYQNSEAAAANTVYKDLPGGAPKQGIIVDDVKKFWTIKPEYSTTNPHFVETPIWNNEGLGVIYSGTMPSGEMPIEGSYSWRWRNIATDQDGDAVDIVMQVSNVRGTGATDSLLTYVYKDGSIAAYAFTLSGAACKNWFDIKFFFYKSNTNDVAANGNWTIQYTDIDVLNQGSIWHETVVLLDNFVEDIHIIPDNMFIPGSGNTSMGGCWLKITNLSTTPTFQPAYAHGDNDTLHSGFCTSARNGFKFSWRGWGCGTRINNIYGQSNIQSSADAGGSITPSGNVEVGWKNDKTCVIEPNLGYKIKDVQVDGSSIGAISSYTFAEVTMNHTIHATFEKIPYTVKFVDSMDGSELSRSTIYHGDTPKTAAPVPPLHPGYEFKGYSPSIEDPITGDTEILLVYEPMSQIVVEIDWADRDDMMNIRPDIALNIPNTISGLDIDAIPITVQKTSSSAQVAYDPAVFDPPGAFSLPDVSPYSLKLVSSNKDVVDGIPTTTYRLRATYVPTKDIRIEKIWHDMDNVYGERPENITVNIYEYNPKVPADVEEVDEAMYWTLYATVEITPPAAEGGYGQETDSNTWSYTLKDIPMWTETGYYANDFVDAKYKVVESDVYGYENTSASGSLQRGEFRLENTCWKHIDMPEAGVSDKTILYIITLGFALTITALGMLGFRRGR